MSKSPDDQWFSPFQKTIITWAICFLSLAVIAASTAALVYYLGNFLSKFSNLLGPLALAGITALILKPYVEMIEKRLKIGSALAVVIIYSATFIILTLAAWLFLPELVTQSIEFSKKVPNIIDRAVESLSAMKNKSKFDLDSDIHSVVETVKSNAQSLAYSVFNNMSSAGTKILSFFGFLAGFAVVPVYIFYFLKSKEDPMEKLREFLPFFKDDKKEDVIFLVKEFVAINVSFFRGQIVIGMITGVLYATGFTMSGLAAGLFIGVLLGFLNIIPYLGSIIGILIIVPTGLFQEGGGWMLLLKCGATVMITQMLVDWYFTPKIMGKQTGLHPVVIIISIFFWGTALHGILGMLLAIPLTAFLVTVWRLLQRKYIKPII
ncbi:MAG: AI-2E family transporter [Verrucomicrobiota bacterium]|nr:AI-2E family transporter [Verrucomicrobiota bacterium]